MGLFRSFSRAFEKSVKESQKAAAAQKGAAARDARDQAARQRDAEAMATLEAARRASPYFRDSSAPAGSRIATLEPWPVAPEGDDAALEAWYRKVTSIDRRLGLWTGEWESDLAGEYRCLDEWAWVTEGAEASLDGANVVLELLWVPGVKDGEYGPPSRLHRGIRGRRPG